MNSSKILGIRSIYKNKLCFYILNKTIWKIIFKNSSYNSIKYNKTGENLNKDVKNLYTKDKIALIKEME